MFETCQTRVQVRKLMTREMNQTLYLRLDMLEDHSHQPQLKRQHQKSPEDVRPYPKSASRNEKIRRGKARKSTILTNTPERERAALAAEGKKKKKSGPVKHTLTFSNAEAELDPEEVVEDEERTNPEEPIKFQDNDPEPGDYVLV
ncbi:hypothetical protein LSH36_166g06012 [Paralvinella palmiformis]|uniref:Uncharacterized protein n=1 Tax=Paralvinella palmiformis TaxID=53620 RepID=A0AAD9JU38_9ANNE|nr:hypothetical protein LSH36_166g06012 [Paralvinella palmiformis]